MELVDLKCQQCGASLPPQAQGGVYRCTYCGHAYEPAPAPAPPPQVVRIQLEVPASALRQARIGGGRPSGGARGVGCLVPILVAAGIFVYFQTRRSGGVAMPTALGPGSSLFTPAERLYWDSVGGPPQGATIGGAPHAIGRIRVAGGDQLFVALVNPNTASLGWRFGPLGTYSQGYQATKFFVQGDRVVVSDYKSAVHLVDVQTGKEVGQAKLTDRVERMCAGPGGAVWIGTVDKRGTVLDVHSGATHEGPKPAAGCEDDWAARMKHGGKEVSPKIAGFAAHRTLVDGDVGVAAGGKSPGTEVPMAVGFDPKTGAARWTVTLPTVDASLVRPRSNEHDALAPGIYVTSWGTGDKGWHISALEPRSGARLWNTELPKIFAVDSIDGVVASGGWVYVTRTSSLAILNGTTGKLVGAIGDETYEK